MTASATRISLCPLSDVPVGMGRPFVVGDRPIAVFRSRAGRVFATDGFCPHKGGPLADGMLGANDRVVCPYHGFRYDSNSGECDQAGACAIATYPVEIVNGEIRVSI